MRLVQREDVLFVAKKIRARGEVSRMRRNFEFERVAMLAGFMSRLQVQRLPRRRGRRGVTIAGEMRDVIDRHGRFSSGA